MLVEMAIGDAYGAAFEYVSPSFLQRHHDLTRYVQHPNFPIGAGRYTDDTQMSLAIAETLVDARPWNRSVLAEAFVRVFKRDPRLGYASRFQEFLERIEDGAQFLAEIIPRSDKSGGAMRAPPLGVLSSTVEVIERATAQAALTHDTPDGRSAAAAALATHYCLYDRGPRAGVGCLIEDLLGGQWSVPWQGEVEAQGWMSVRAALTALSEQATMTGLLRACVDFGGDVDTVATIALAAGSCCREVAQDLPAWMFPELENGLYGRDYLAALDRRLLALARR